MTNIASIIFFKDDFLQHPFRISHYSQVIRKSKCLDEVLAKLDPQAATNHFKAIRKWKAKREHLSPREGAFLLFSQKKLKKAERQALENLANGRDTATLKVMCCPTAATPQCCQMKYPSTTIYPLFGMYYLSFYFFNESYQTLW